MKCRWVTTLSRGRSTRARRYRQRVDVLELQMAAAMLAIEDPRIAPGGPIARYLGEQLTESEVANALDQHWSGLVELPVLELRSIRSFPSFHSAGSG